MSRQGVTIQHCAPSRSAKGNSFSLHHLLTATHATYGYRFWGGVTGYTGVVTLVAFSNPSGLGEKWFCWQTCMVRLIFFYRSTQCDHVAQCKVKNAYTYCHLDVRSWHKNYSFFYCGYWLMKLKPNGIISQGRTSNHRPHCNPFLPSSAKQSHFWDKEVSRLRRRLEEILTLERLVYEALNEKIKYQIAVY